MLLNDRVAMVTGAAGGIGASCALAFAKNGAKKVFVIDIDGKKAQTAMQEINKHTEGIFIRADLAESGDIDGIFKRIEEEGRLDVLVNCAGITSVQPFEEMTPEVYDKIMDINLRAAVFCCKYAVRMMRAQKYGRIINFASISGQVGGIRTSPAYALSKAGMLCLTKSLAKGTAKDNITVNSVSPGIIDTDMTRAPDFNYSTDEIPMGYAGNVEDVSNAVLFLASDMSGYITGQCINVNGGMYMA